MTNSLADDIAPVLWEEQERRELARLTGKYPPPEPQSPSLEVLQRRLKGGYIRFEDKPTYWWEMLGKKR